MTLPRFIFLSACIHGLVAGLLHYHALEQVVHPTPGSPLLLTLQTFSEPANKQQETPDPLAKTTPPQQAVDTRTKKTVELSTTPETIATNKVRRQQNVTTNTQAHADQKDNTDTLNALRSAVYSALHTRFTYPRRARLRGWEGTVVISLRILPDGNLTNIQVAGSSGITVLDRAAIASIRKITIPQAIALMHGRELDMTIPIEYRLLDT